MTYRVSRVSVLQAAKMFGVLYAIMGLIIIPFFYVVARAVPSGSSPFGGVWLLLLPILYGCLGFVVTAIAAAIYNLVARWIGGIEVELAAPPNT